MRPESRASWPSALSSTVFSWTSSAAAITWPRASSTAAAIHRREARVDGADCLVAELEHVGVEERQVVVRHARAGHVRADDLAVGLGMVLVLDPEPPAERGRREARDVAGREDVLVPLDPSELVDEDAVVDGEPRRLGEVRGRLDAEPGDDGVRLERAARAGRDLPPAGRDDGLLRQDLDALLPVVVG